jgi:hypothetical protein
LLKTILGDYVLTNDEIILGLPLFQITRIERTCGEVSISARYTGPKSCPHCYSERQRSKGWYSRLVRHEDWGLRHARLGISARKWECLDCGRQFRQRLPGILPGQHASEAFREAVFQQHLDGINAAGWADGRVSALLPSNAISGMASNAGFPRGILINVRPSWALMSISLRVKKDLRPPFAI